MCYIFSKVNQEDISNIVESLYSIHSYSIMIYVIKYLNEKYLIPIKLSLEASAVRKNYSKRYKKIIRLISSRLDDKIKI